MKKPRHYPSHRRNGGIKANSDIIKKAAKLGLIDKGLNPNHICGRCGAKTRLGEDADGQTVSYCPKCNFILHVFAVPRFPKSSFIKKEPHID